MAGKILRLFSQLRQTPLTAFNKEVLKGRMIEFGGYCMPVEFKERSGGSIAEHKHVREHAGLFDISHVGILRIHGKDRFAFLNRLLVADTAALQTGQAAYSVLMKDNGGVLDDTIVTSYEGHVAMVINAGSKVKNIDHMKSHIFGDVTIEHLEDHGVLALSGPRVAEVLQKLVKEDLSKLKFMNGFYTKISKIDADVLIDRCGYTGEDGLEIVVKSSQMLQLAELLLSDPLVKPIGLGARDSLRLEAGLCLYGKDYLGRELNEDTTPIEAGLIWTIPKTRRENGGFLGDAVVTKQIKEGAKVTRVGFVMKEGTSAREGASVVKEGREIGKVCSGGFSPILRYPIGMAYIEKALAQIGTQHEAIYRGKQCQITLAKMPFVQNRYFK